MRTEGFRFEEEATSTQGLNHDLLNQSLADIHLEPTEPLHETLQVFWLHASPLRTYRASSSPELSLTGPKFVEDAQEQPHSPGPPLDPAHSHSPNDFSLSQTPLPTQSPTATSQTLTLHHPPLEPLIPDNLNGLHLNTSPSSPNPRPKKRFRKEIEKLGRNLRQKLLCGLFTREITGVHNFWDNLNNGDSSSHALAPLPTNVNEGFREANPNQFPQTL